MPRVHSPGQLQPGRHRSRPPFWPGVTASTTGPVGVPGRFTSDWPCVTAPKSCLVYAPLLLQIIFYFKLLLLLFLAVLHRILYGGEAFKVIQFAVGAGADEEQDPSEYCAT